MPGRAQSELVGGILVLGLVVVSVGVAGAYAMGTVTQSTEAPQATVTGQISTDELVLVHQGGDTLPSDELRLVVRVNGSKTGLSWNDGTLSGGDDVFEPGEMWTASESYDSDDVVTLRLIHEPSNTVLFRTETTPRVTTPIESDAGGYVEAADSEGISGGVTTGEGGERGGPIEAAVFDLTYIDGDSPQYVVSYDAGPVNDSFDHVEIEFDGAGYGSYTTRVDQPLGSVKYDGDNGRYEDYTITVRTHYQNGSVGRTRTFADRADTFDPSGDDLGDSGSPRIRDVTITDKSNPRPDKLRYRFDYDVERNGNFGGVVFGVISTERGGDAVIEPSWNNPSDDQIRTATKPTGSQMVSSDYGAWFGTRYKLVMLVFDDDGVVVDSRIVFDRADGDG